MEIDEQINILLKNFQKQIEGLVSDVLNHGTDYHREELIKIFTSATEKLSKTVKEQ